MVVAKQAIILLVNSPHTNSVLTLVLSAWRPEDRLTIYYTVFEFYKGRLKKFSPRRLAMCEIWLDLFTWSVENHLGFGEKCVSLAFPGTQRLSCSELPSSNLSIAFRCGKVVPAILSEDKI